MQFSFLFFEKTILTDKKMNFQPLLTTWGTWSYIVAILIGFLLLVYSADWLVDGASAVAKRFNVSELVIGLTIVAFGTSMPEFVVNMVAAIEHNSEIAITNILGSNSINTFVILGLTAIIYPVSSQVRSRRFDIPMSLLAGLIVLALVCISMPHAGHGWVFQKDCGTISRYGGIILLLCMALFLWYNFTHAKADEADEEVVVKPMSIGKAIVLILLGLAGLCLGGQLMVDSATLIAQKLNVSDAIIGLTVVALGTSLPELATSCIAAAKKNSDLALGNVIGSNLFNIFFILGTSATIYPLQSYNGVWLDALMVVISGMLTWLFVVSNKKKEIKRWEGVLLLLIYGIYLTYRILQVSGHLPAGALSL